eukprot:s275_g36.t1
MGLHESNQCGFRRPRIDLQADAICAEGLHVSPVSPADFEVSLRIPFVLSRDVRDLLACSFRTPCDDLRAWPGGDKDETGCSFSLMPLDVPPPRGPLFIFGDPFLRRFVTIYDKSGPSVGFAVSKHEAMDEIQASKLIVTAAGSEPVEDRRHYGRQELGEFAASSASASNNNTY